MRKKVVIPIEAIVKLLGIAKSPFWRLLPPFLFVYPTRVLPRQKGMGCSKAAATEAKSTKIIDFLLAGSFAIASIVATIGLVILGISQLRPRKVLFIDKISSNLSHHPQWDVHPVDIDLKIFDQPFIYLDKGIQCYAFVSSDGAYVLKFFNFDNMKPSFNNKHNQRQPILETDFNSCKLAFEELAEETGLLYVHLNKTQHIKKKVVLTNNSGRKNLIDLDRTEFVLQRKAELVYPSLDRWMEKGEVEKAKGAIDSILEVLVARSKKGIEDEDPLISRNLGFIGTQAIIIDIGCFSKNKEISDPVVYRQNLLTVTAPFKQWLDEHHPVLAIHLEEQLKR